LVTPQGPGIKQISNSFHHLLSRHNGDVTNIVVVVSPGAMTGLENPEALFDKFSRGFNDTDYPNLTLNIVIDSNPKLEILRRGFPEATNFIILNSPIFYGGLNNAEDRLSLKGESPFAFEDKSDSGNIISLAQFLIFSIALITEHIEPGDELRFKNRPHIKSLMIALFGEVLGNKLLNDYDGSEEGLRAIIQNAVKRTTQPVDVQKQILSIVETIWTA